MLQELKDADAHGVVFWLTFALVVKLAGMFFGVLRWRLLLRGQGLQIPFLYLVQSWFIGRTIGIFLPGTIGLDGYRLYDSSRYTGEVIKCTTVVAVEKLIGIIALTGLVFVTFPLGFRLLNINLPVLAIILTILGSMVAVAFLLLLNPRVIQVIMAVIPTPNAIRTKLNKLGASATAYSGNRRELLLAVLFGILVHVGTCFMYFGTMMAIRAANTGLLDILFASPLMIYGTVLGPSVGGEGIREIVFVTMLSAKTSAAAAATLAHLGWWVGELVPFIIGAVVFVTRAKPDKEEMTEALAEARKRAAEVDASVDLHLAPEVVSDYRRKVFAVVAAGLLAGLAAGALIGLGESAWILHSLSGLKETAMFSWGAAVYGLLFAGVGLGVAGGLLFLYLLFDKFASWVATYALSFSGALAAGTLIIGFFRLKRDVLGGHNPGMGDLIKLGMLVGGVALAGLVLAALFATIKKKALKNNPALLVITGLLVYGVLIAGGVVAAKVTRPEAEAHAFNPVVQAQGPNIILVAIDALRADYLRCYAPEAEAATPNLDAFLKDAVLFKESYSQASWTKPSFATLFTGLYPEMHTATTKTSGIPEEVETLAEVLQEGGYYTQGFSNNPNVTALFNFDQGFVDYTDLKPRLQFFAAPSAAKLSMYEVLRKGRQRIASKFAFLPGVGGMEVWDFYQPAEAITDTALAWADTKAPKETPFYLYLHYMDPHDPFMDHSKSGVGYARARMENPDPEKYLAPMRAAYNSEIEYLDIHLGRLFEGLKDRGLYENTVIVFTGDHGEEFYDHEGWWHGQTLYDELIHVPIAIKLPKNDQGGKINTDFARHIDLAPTMLHCAGLKKGKTMPGQSIFDANFGFANPGVAYSYAENDFEGNVLQAVRSKTHKLIHANEDNNRNLAPVEFFDLEKDPQEENNLADIAEYLDQKTTFTEAMKSYEKVIKENAAEPTADVALNAELQEQMKSLGYLE